MAEDVDLPFRKPCCAGEIRLDPLLCLGCTFDSFSGPWGNYPWAKDLLMILIKGGVSSSMQNFTIFEEYSPTPMEPSHLRELIAAFTSLLVVNSFIHSVVCVRLRDCWQLLLMFWSISISSTSDSTALSELS